LKLKKDEIVKLQSVKDNIDIVFNCISDLHCNEQSLIDIDNLVECVYMASEEIARYVINNGGDK